MLFVKSITVQKESSMRYFKCPPPDKAENEKFKKQHAELLIKEKAFKKKEKILHRIYWILFFVIFCCITIAGTWLVWQIPEPKSILLCAGLYLTRFISILVFYDLRCHHCRPCGFGADPCLPSAHGQKALHAQTCKNQCGLCRGFPGICHRGHRQQQCCRQC